MILHLITSFIANLSLSNTHTCNDNLYYSYSILEMPRNICWRITNSTDFDIEARISFDNWSGRPLRTCKEFMVHRCESYVSCWKEFLSLGTLKCNHNKSHFLLCSLVTRLLIISISLLVDLSWRMSCLLHSNICIYATNIISFPWIQIYYYYEIPNSESKQCWVILFRFRKSINWSFQPLSHQTNILETNSIRTIPHRRLVHSRQICPKSWLPSRDL